MFLFNSRRNRIREDIEALAIAETFVAFELNRPSGLGEAPDVRRFEQFRYCLPTALVFLIAISQLTVSSLGGIEVILVRLPLETGTILTIVEDITEVKTESRKVRF